MLLLLKYIITIHLYLSIGFLMLNLNIKGFFHKMYFSKISYERTIQDTESWYIQSHYGGILEIILFKLFIEQFYQCYNISRE